MICFVSGSAVSFIARVKVMRSPYLASRSCNIDSSRWQSGQPHKMLMIRGVCLPDKPAPGGESNVYPDDDLMGLLVDMAGGTPCNRRRARSQYSAICPRGSSA